MYLVYRYVYGNMCLTEILKSYSFFFFIVVTELL